jgi:PAS domain S-box-containing protein
MISTHPPTKPSKASGEQAKRERSLHAKAALVASEVRYRRLFESAKDGILILDAETGDITDANPFLLELLRYRYEDVVGKKVWEVGLLANVAANQAKFTELQRQEYVRYDDLPLEASDGRRVEVEFVSNLYLVDDRKVIQCNIRDISERKQMEEALARSRSQLFQAQKMEAVGRLAGGVAHDFNNILQALLSQVMALSLRVKTPELAKALVEIDSLVERGGDLTRQLLLFARREVAKQEIIDLGEVTSTASLMLRHLIPENIRQVVETTSDRIFVKGDPGQVQQIIMNLVVNAKDAMPEGGTVTVRAGADHGEAFLEVSDTGRGMDEHTRAHLFEPFFTTKEEFRGSGLGLSVVHGIVEQHGGRIEVESTPGKGSRFRVVFPSVRSPERTARSTSIDEDDLPKGHGEWVLLVEDEEATRRSLQEILELLGYQVTALANGEEAERLPERPVPDLLLTDLMLPGIPGSRLAAGLSKRWPGLRVLLMSGYTDDEALHRGVGDGTLHFLQKPFGIALLAREIRAALEK